MEPTWKWIPKKELEHEQYYVGTCRNAKIARWNATKNCFVHWRTKFGFTFLEEIRHPEDEQNFDVFYPLYPCSEPNPIPL